MTFLNTALLFALGLITLPVIIHLFGRQRRKTEVFSSLSFLKNLQTDKMKKLKLRQLILLILRTLGVLFLVLAFLRPAFKSANFTGSGKTHSVVLLDLSASMEKSSGENKRVDLARKQLEEIWQSSDIVSLVVLQQSDQDDIIRDSGEGRDVDFIRKLSTDGRHEDFGSAFGRAEDILEGSEATVKEIVLISDFNSPLPDSLLTSPMENYHFWCVPIGEEEPAPNLFIEKAEIRQAVFTPGETIHLDITFSYVGEIKSASGAILSLDGKIIANTSIDPGNNEKISKSIAFKCPESGQYRGEIEIEAADALLLDNRYNFILKVPEKKRVLLAGENLLALNHLYLALQSNQRQNFDVTLKKSSLAEVDFTQYDVLLLSDPGTINRETLKRINQAVRLSGLGLWVLPGERTDIPRLNRYLLSELDMGELSFENNRSSLSWDRMDQTHPVFDGIIKGDGEIDNPIQNIRFKLNEHETIRNLVFLSNGWPCLVEAHSGKGKVWLSTFNADSSSSDWMMSGIFAPMVQLSALYLGNGTLLPSNSLVCGDDIVWRKTASFSGQELYTVEDPVGNQLSTRPIVNRSGKSLLTEGSKWPGFYSLKKNQTGVDEVAVNVPEEESQFYGFPFNSSKLKGHVVHLNENESLSEALKSRRFGKEISWLLLILAMVTFIAESLIARESRIKKYE